MPTARNGVQAMILARKNMARVVAATHREAFLIVTQGRAELLPMVRAQLSKPGSGKVYPSRRGSGTHRASAPGEPPAPDTGQYRASVITRSGMYSNTTFWLGTGSPAEYAYALEYGRTSRLKPRPHFEPAMRQWITARYLPRVQARFASAQRKAALGQPIYFSDVGGPMNVSSLMGKRNTWTFRSPKP